MKKNKAITLISLVITIVVLIILAAVAINLSLGNNGIFNRAKTAKEQYQNAEEEEETEIAKAINKIDNYVDASRGNISEEEYKRIQAELNSLKEDFTGNFYLSGTADSANTYSRTSYFDINVKNYNQIEIDVTGIFPNSNVYTCYINGDGTKIQDIVGTGKRTIDVTNYKNILL